MPMSFVLLASSNIQTRAGCWDSVVNSNHRCELRRVRDQSQHQKRRETNWSNYLIHTNFYSTVLKLVIKLSSPSTSLSSWHFSKMISNCSGRKGVPILTFKILFGDSVEISLLCWFHLNSMWDGKGTMYIERGVKAHQKCNCNSSIKETRISTTNNARRIVIFYLLFCFSNLFLSRDARKTTNGNVAQLKVFCDQTLPKSCNFYPQEMLHYEVGWFFSETSSSQIMQTGGWPLRQQTFYFDVVDSQHLILYKEVTGARFGWESQIRVELGHNNMCHVASRAEGQWPDRARKLAISHQ